MRVALYGRTYLDVEVEVPLASLAQTKGKVDAEVRTVHGGFANNAARALADRFGPGEVRVVTVSPRHDLPLLRESLPESVGLDALLSEDGRALPPVSVIIDPARACRIFRNPEEQDERWWRPERVPEEALGARLHVCGRLPPRFAAAVLKAARARGARFAWVGGASLPLRLERQCDLLCVNTREARALVGDDSLGPLELSARLAARATVASAVRVVTGGGQAATVASLCLDHGIIQHFESTPRAVPAEKIVRLLGVGDAFAAHFLAHACFDARGKEREAYDVKGALAAAQRVAGRFIVERSAA